jgi:hypothetical protein
MKEANVFFSTGVGSAFVIFIAPIRRDDDSEAVVD